MTLLHGWWSANEIVEADDPKLGKLRISQWKDLHFRSSSSHDMSLIWLASDLVKDWHLPWQSSQQNLTPGRVAQSLLSLLVEIGTPTKAPQPRGKSPGWKQGEKRSQRKTYPTAKKSYSRAKKTKKQAL